MVIIFSILVESIITWRDNLIFAFIWQEEGADPDLWGVPTAVEPGAGPAFAGPVLPAPTASSAVCPAPELAPLAPPLEGPLSPRAVALVSDKLPGSPKARRPAQDKDGKSLSSDESSASKRGLEGASSPQDHKKRRLHRTTKPRKPWITPTFPCDWSISRLRGTNANTIFIF